MGRIADEVKVLVKQLHDNGQTPEQIREIVKEKLKAKISVASIYRICGLSPTNLGKKRGGDDKDMKHTRRRGRRRAADLQDLASMSIEDLLQEIVAGFQALSELRTKLLLVRGELIKAVGQVRKMRGELNEVHQAEEDLAGGK